MTFLTTLPASSVLARAAALAALWWILTAGAPPGSWVIGLPAVMLAVAASVRLVPATRVSLPHLMRFLPQFLLRSLLAAFDVARRTLAPGLPIAPARIEYGTALREGLPRVVFMNTVSLLPGTLSASEEDGRLSVHVLDRDVDHAAQLASLERTIARIFPESEA